jgi:hypothetical protein
MTGIKDKGDEDEIKEHLIKDNVLRRQLNDFQLVGCGGVLEGIYLGRHGSNQDTKTGKFKPSGTNVAHGRKSDLVAKDLGTSGSS